MYRKNEIGFVIGRKKNTMDRSVESMNYKKKITRLGLMYAQSILKACCLSRWMNPRKCRSDLQRYLDFFASVRTI